MSEWFREWLCDWVSGLEKIDIVFVGIYDPLSF